MQTNFKNILDQKHHQHDGNADGIKFDHQAKVFPDIRFPDGRMMVWDYAVAKYVDAPGGYERTDVVPIQMGHILIFPYQQAYQPAPPTIEEINRHRQHMLNEWMQTLRWLRHVVKFTTISLGIVAVLTFGGYAWQVIRAFGANGAPAVAAAVGDVISYLVYILAGGILLFFIGAVLVPTMFKRNVQDFTPDQQTPATGGGGDNQQININIFKNFNPGDDAAQRFTNNM